MCKGEVKRLEERGLIHKSVEKEISVVKKHQFYMHFLKGHWIL